MRYIVCDLCGKDETAVICHPLLTVGPVVKCSNCRLVYVNPRVQNEEIRSKLSRRYQNLGLAFEYESKWRNLRFVEKVNIIQRHKRSGRLLDMGCASGVFLKIAEEFYDCYGVDTNPVHCQKAKDERSLRVFNGTLKEAKFESNFFDIIVALNVLEHTYSPMSELKEMNRVLKRKGILMLEIPNIQSIWFKMFRKKWRQFLPDHYFYFSPDTITKYLQKTSFDVLKIGYDKKIFDLGYMVSRFSLINRRLGKLFSKLIFQMKLNNKLIKFKFSDSLLVIAEKEVT